MAGLQTQLTDHSVAKSGADVGVPTKERSGRPQSDRSRPGQTRDSISRTSARRKSVILFANQLAVMVDTGVPLTQALQSIADRAEDEKFATILQQVTDSVESGVSFSAALSRHPRAFPRLMIALLQASEASGTMGPMLARIATYLNKEHEIRRQVHGALMYPALMFTLCLGITIFLLTYILPKFAVIYEARHATLPGPTRFLISLSSELVTHWYFWVAGSVAFATAMFIWRQTPFGKIQIDWLKLNLPVVSNVFSPLYVSRGCRTLGTMNESGVPLLESIAIVREVTDNVHYDRLWDHVDENLRHGRPLSNSLFDSAVIPDQVAQMIQSGETAGRLGAVFARVADFAEAEFEQAVKTTMQFIEPVMILTMGSVIGFIAIAMLIPIFNVGRVVSGG